MKHKVNGVTLVNCITTCNTRLTERRNNERRDKRDWAIATCLCITLFIIIIASY